MIRHNEQLKQKARELALVHHIRKARRPLKHQWSEFSTDVESLQTFVRLLQDSGSYCSQPAEEWLLDNAEFINEQALVVRLELSNAYLRRLPRLSKNRELRVLSLCAEYLANSDGVLDADSFITYVNSYQEVSVLTIAEAWSLPHIMRIALIRRLSGMMKLVRERHEVCAQVERLLAHIETSELNPNALKAALDNEGEDIPLSGPLIVHLVNHLSERTDDVATVREWLKCKLENGPESLNHIISYEHQLQAGYQVSAGNLIQSLRTIAHWNWRDSFESICLVEHTLSGESSGVYRLLDFASRDTLRKRVELLARRLHVPENLIAKQAVELAERESGTRDTAIDDMVGISTDANNPSRQTFAAYYLLDPQGIAALRRELCMCSSPKLMPELVILQHATGTYFSMLAGLFVLILILFAVWVNGHSNSTAAMKAAILLTLMFPASEWAITVLHGLINCFMPSRPLLRYDFASGVSDNAATMVVIPVIWSTSEEVQELMNRLELHYLANRDPNIHFALLGDFIDAPTESLINDASILTAARSCIEALNTAYAQAGRSTFHLFQRRRQWNSSENVWMGWERKRGKLVEFVELIKGRTDTSYDFVIGDTSVLSRIRYIITLDSDTQLPMGSAQRMIGTMHLPYNHPRLNRARTRVIEGYGVLQPRIAISHEAAMRSRLAGLWSGEPGIDPYAFAVSNPYQDGLEQGIFTGKGIFDVDTFAEILCERIPENRVLSHDLLEGGFLRGGLLADIELIDEHPSTFSTYQQRQHRWVRGDWQLLIWLFPRVADRRNALLPVDLSMLTRWQMIDNLRRSLFLPVLFALLALSLSALPGSPGIWLAITFATLSLPIIRTLTAVRRIAERPQVVLAAFGQVLVTVLTLPFQCALLLDGIGKSLIRLFFSKRLLLEWVNSAEIERRNRSKRYPAILGLRGGYLMIMLFVLVAAYSAPSMRWLGFTLCALWALAPFGVRWLDQSIAQPTNPLTVEEEDELRALAGQIWAYYEEFSSEQDHWLPPDNVQFDPPNGAAHRTSPTNIGLLLVCTIAARDFGFINTPGLIERLERTVSTIERLDKWSGHIYNWYDTLTLAPLPPLYVSTVDSGNFVAYLITAKEGIAEWLKTDFTRQQPSTVDGDHKAWQERGLSLITRLESLITETDFRPLYDHKSQLFTLGYHVALGERETILYDLLASEARQASFTAIAMGQVPAAHWFALGRTMTKIGKQATLISWSGTMFEYLMPSLIMRTYRNTVWESTYRGVIKRQIEYAHRRGVPFGVSESGYYAFDYQMNYQYRAFGVPSLGFKRGLEQDLVITPYATILALPFAKRDGLADLHRMDALGARGPYGYYEAIDCTQERIPADHKHMVIRSYMAHHQGMSLLSLANLLLTHKMYERFHRDKRVQAAELLLQERIPARSAIILHPMIARLHVKEPKLVKSSPILEHFSADTTIPEVCLISNGTYITMLTNSGSGFSRCAGAAVSRWHEDPVLDDWGNYIYIRDVTHNAVWSPTFQPCRAASDKQRAQYSTDHATFMREDGDIQTSLEICVSPEWNAEVRRLTLTNTGSEACIIEVTTFLEVVLAPPAADDAHPAFSKLFIETQYDSDAECLLARRRTRDSSEKPIWAAHALIVGCQPLGSVEYETDRSCFIGRGHTISQPQGIHSRLSGTVGAVLDPAFIMRRRLMIGPGECVQAFAITGAADTRDEVFSIIDRLRTDQQVERTFQLASTRSQIELRHLHLSAAEAMVFQSLAGRALYAAPLKHDQEISIAMNTKGQSGLWAHGISGDLPIVLVRIENAADLSFVVKLILGFVYLRRKGLQIDLVILNESASGYQQDLHDAIRRAVDQVMESYIEKLPWRVYPILANQLSDADRHLLIAVSRVLLRADGPSLKAQLKLSQRNKSLPALLVPQDHPFEHDGVSTDSDTNDLIFFNGWGGFSKDGREYRIVLKNGSHLQAPWVNVIANPSFGCLISELGTGYTWWRNSREFKITPWSNDPVLDPPGELCYLRDEMSGEVWTVTPSPIKNSQTYIISHGRGYTRFCHESHGFKQEMTVFVPLEDPVKLIELRLCNQTDRQRSLSVTYYVEWVLGVRREANAPFIVTEWDDATHSLLAHNMFQETFREATAFLHLSQQTETSALPPNLSWTADRQEFIGRNGLLESPAALSRQRLSGTTGPLYNPCGSIQLTFTIEPHCEQKVSIMLGCANSREAAARLAVKYNQSATREQAFEQVGEFWDGVLDQIIVSTPSPELDVLLNNWLLYQVLGCRMRARTAFYQAGGAYGFRDQLQDSLALLHSRPDLTRAQILLHAAHQYEEGDVQHWWHEETDRGIRTRYSDDLLWLPYTVARYVKHTGDDGILDEVVPFLHSEPLREGEHERYEPTVVSHESGTIYEHCLLALDHSLKFGEHGLPLIGIGDWNDGLNRVGDAGRGESVWLGWFLSDVLGQFTDLCERRGDVERAKQYGKTREVLAASLNEHAWDGEWYRRAVTDDGQWLGSIHNKECRIDAIAQSWSVISKVAPRDKALCAMHSFDRELVDRNLFIAKLLTPPFDHTDPSPGYIQGYPPGIRENGGQYTHGVIWSIIAWCQLDDGNKAFELFHMLNPISHARTPGEVRTYAGEPYVMAADVYSGDPHKGRAGWTWYTGAAGWMYQAGIEWILGLRRHGKRLYICPCIPHEWPEFSISYRFGSSGYKIKVKNPMHKSSGATSFTIDGQETDLKALSAEGGPYVELLDDGQLHHVDLIL